MQEPVHIREVSNRGDMHRFIKFPWLISSSDPHWVPPLLIDQKNKFDAKKNPFYQENWAAFYMAYRQGKPVGRIAAIISEAYNQIHSQKAGFFGFLEAVEDASVFQALLRTVEIALRNQGCKLLLGPMNPSSNYEMGFLIDGFDTPPYIMLTHNPPYYNEMLLRLGYQKEKDFYCYLLDRSSLRIDDKISRTEQAITKRYAVRVRPGDLRRFDEEIRIIREIYNDAWTGQWGFTPMSEAEFNFIGRDLKMIIDPELVLIAEREGDPAGFVLALPNINELLVRIRSGRLLPGGIFRLLAGKKRIRSARVLTMGVKQKYQRVGVVSLFYMKIIKHLLERGYTHAEMSWILEDNKLARRSAEMLGGKIYKTYRVYQKELPDA